MRSRLYVSHATTTWLVFRILGAAAVVALGAVHLHEYAGPYGAIPTIGTLFLVNFVTSVAIGLVLLAPVEHIAGRWAGAVVAVATVGGIVLAATSYVMLLISERRPLFGFEEPGYDPPAIAASRVLAIAIVVLLGVSLLLRSTTDTPKRRW
jgi:hypothetical protein